MLKKKSVKIKSICCKSDEGIIIGLGSDGNVYKWEWDFDKKGYRVWGWYSYYWFRKD